MALIGLLIAAVAVGVLRGPNTIEPNYQSIWDEDPNSAQFYSTPDSQRRIQDLLGAAGQSDVSDQRD